MYLDQQVVKRPYVFEDEETNVLLTGRIARFWARLPAFSGASCRGIGSDIVGAPTTKADGIGITSQDDVAAHAVVGVGFGAVDGDVEGDPSGNGGDYGNQYGERSNSTMLHGEDCVMFKWLVMVLIVQVPGSR